MNDKQRLAIMTALGVLREADIKAGLHKIYGSEESELIISLPKVKSDKKEKKVNEQV